MNDVDIFLNGGLTDEQNAMLRVVCDIRMDIFNVERYAREIGQNDIFTKTYIDRLIGNMRISGASGLTMDANISMFGALAERYLARRKYLTELLSKRVGRPMGAINAVEKFDECNKWLVAHNQSVSLPADAFEVNRLMEAFFDLVMLMRKWDNRKVKK